MNCPNCDTPIQPETKQCPNCRALIAAASLVRASERGVAAGRDINAPVFTGDINAPVTIAYTALAPIPDPPPPDRPPLVRTFIGREQELAYFGQMLATTNMVVITGMAGTGKTTLAAALARGAASPGKIFWYTFHMDEGIDAILWRLAAFLATHSQADPWTTLNRGRNIPREETFRYLIQAIRGQGFLLCLDAFEHVEDDSLIGQLVEALREAVAAGDIALILTSRRVPAFVQENHFNPLEGFSQKDTASLVQAFGLNLDPAQLQSLHETTGGNAELLILAAQAVQSSRSPNRLIENLAEAQNIERFLLDEVDRGLTEPERHLLAAAAALLGYPVSRQSLETLLDTGVRRPLADLLRDHLLTAAEGRYGVEYSLHAMLQSFYYDTLGPSQKRALHLRAARFYETEQVERYRAALYYERGGEPAKTAALVFGSLEEMINQGHARSLARLLERIPAEILTGVSGTQVTLALGELYGFLGEEARAGAALLAAWAGLETQPDEPPIKALRARTCHSLGAFLEFEDPQLALEWLQRGLEVLGNEPVEGTLAAQLAALHIRAGSVLFQLGNYPEATSALEAGLALLPADQPTPLAAIGQRCLGEVAFSLGSLEQAVSYLNQSLETSHKLGDTFEIANGLIDLGIFRHTANDWPGSIAAFEEALEIARKLDSRKQQAMLHLNLGAARTYMADDEAAQSHLQESLALAEASNLVMIRAMALFRTADLHIRREEWQMAQDNLQQAESCAKEIDFRPVLISIFIARAEAETGQGRPQEGEANASAALQLAEELGEDLESAIAMRVQAQALLALGSLARSVELLDHSLELLEGQDIYEAARTREVIGWALQAQSQPEAAVAQLRMAHGAFLALGAKRDLARTEQQLALNGAS